MAPLCRTVLCLVIAVGVVCAEEQNAATQQPPVQPPPTAQPTGENPPPAAQPQPTGEVPQPQPTGQTPPPAAQPQPTGQIPQPQPTGQTPPPHTAQPQPTGQTPPPHTAQPHPAGSTPPTAQPHPTVQPRPTAQVPPTGNPPPAGQVPPVHQDIEAEEETARLTREWDQHMADFVPADLVTFEIPARSHEEFFELIDDVPSKVRGAFFVSSKETKDVDLVIYDPTKQVVYEARKKKEDLFYFDASRRGQYVFLFNNNKFVEKVQITFAMHTGNSSETVLDKEHLTPVESSLFEVQKSVKEFQMDQQFAQLRQESHYKTVESANRDVFWFSLLECVGIAGVTCWQVYYVKRILDHRRMI